MKRMTLVLALLFCAMFAVAQNVNLTLRSNLPYPGQNLSNIWGYVDSLGNEYALVGAAEGLSIVNVTDPANPFQVIQIPGPVNDWREIKTYKHYAYVTTEGGSGLQIVDLQNLPGTNLPSHFWAPTIQPQNTPLSSIHALHVDTAKGFVYLYGSNVGNQGAIVGDLNPDPFNPVYAGQYDIDYIHDGYVNNDTLYGGHILSGYFSVIDFRDKMNPVVLATQNTPNNFTHNTWPSVDGNTLFTTDETDYSYLTSYDITDINNITELDRVQVTPGSGSVVHNTYIHNDWAVTSWYKDGVVIVDGHRPQNLVVVGRYDTYAGVGGGMTGNWGVYPYLPSGNLVLSNIEEGLYVLSPTYVRAAYLEGTVTDSVCGSQLSGITVTISTTGISEQTDLAGLYKTGYHTPGTYTVTFSKLGYNTKTYTNVNLSAGNVTNLDVKLYSPTAVSFSGTLDAAGSPVQGAKVVLYNSNNSYNFVSDASGSFSSCNVLSGTYTYSISMWGYKTICGSTTINSGTPAMVRTLEAGYSDNFMTDNGWTISGTAGSGIWQRDVPKLTSFNNIPSNPGIDANDCGNKAFVTGNAGGQASNDDVDDGTAILTSPVFNLTGYTAPYVHYHRWFFNAGGSSAANDSLVISITNGTTTAVLERVAANSVNNSSWVYKSYKIPNYITPGANMRLIVRTMDRDPGHLVEAGFDNFLIADSVLTSGITDIMLNANLHVYPNPFTGAANIDYDLGNTVKDATMIITDVAGREVKRAQLASLQGVVSVGSELSGGVYFVHITSGGQVSSTVKLIKLN